MCSGWVRVLPWRGRLAFARADHRRAAPRFQLPNRSSLSGPIRLYRPQAREYRAFAWSDLMEPSLSSLPGHVRLSVLSENAPTPRHSVGRAGRGPLTDASASGAGQDPGGSASSVLLSVRRDRISEQLGEDKFTEHLHLRITGRRHHNQILVTSKQAWKPMVPGLGYSASCSSCAQSVASARCRCLGW